MKLLRKVLGSKLNNKGVSLVELICALGIMSLVGVGIAGFLTISTRSFVRNSSDVEVQQEAQFAAGIINNLVLSSTEAPVPIADGYEIKVGSDIYQVTHDSTNKVLKLSYNGNVETLAQNVETFSLDFTNKNAKADIVLEKGSKAYRGKNSVKSRNGDTSLVSGDGSATIIVSPEIILEPNQEYDLPVSVAGISNQNVTLELGAGSTDSNTSITGKHIKIGKNETASELNIRIKSNALKPGTTEPAAQATVRMYIRRVNNITVTGTRLSGVHLKAGATYRIFGEISGSNLEKRPTLSTDSDYKETKTVGFLYTYVTETGEIDYRSHVEILAEHQSDGYNPAYVDIKLISDINAHETFTVLIAALHPDGNDGAGNNYNKSGLPYVGQPEAGFTKRRISGAYVLANGYYRYTSGALRRGSDNAQADIAGVVGLKPYYEFVNGNQPCAPGMEWRFRKVVSTDLVTGMRTYGPWTSWLDNPGDSNGSTVVNLRPLATSIFDPDSAYEIQIRLFIKLESTGEVVWPEADTETYKYLIEDSIQPVSLYFRFDGGWNFFTHEQASDPDRGPIPLDNGGNYTMKLSDSDSVSGLKQDLISNSVVYRIERENNDGTWSLVKNMRQNELRIKCDYGHPNGQSDLWTIDQAGSYRVLIEGQNISLSRYSYSAPNRYVENRRDVKFWDLDLNRGVFYFNAN